MAKTPLFALALILVLVAAACGDRYISIGSLCSDGVCGDDASSPLCSGYWTPPVSACQEEGSLCDDGNPCTQDETCQSSVCKGHWLTYCVPCRSNADCCGNVPAYCPGPPGQAELVTTGLCEPNGRCEQKSNVCASGGCSHHGGCP